MGQRKVEVEIWRRVPSRGQNHIFCLESVAVDVFGCGAVFFGCIR